MKTKLPKVKQELKELSKKIRELKFSRGPSNNGFIPELFRIQNTYRYNHVAYCMFHGTPYENIEKPKEGNEIDMFQIESLIKEYHNEVIHTDLQEAV